MFPADRSAGSLDTLLFLLGLALFTPQVAAQATPSPDDSSGVRDAAPAAPGRAQLPDSIQSLVQEFRGLQQRLATLQSQVMQQSPDLRERRLSVQRSIESAMVELDPEIQGVLDRMEALQAQMLEAQQAQDREEVMSLSMEANELRRELQAAQSTVMEQPAIQGAIEEFQDSLLDQMMAHEPETQAMLDELEALSQQIREFQSSQRQGDPGPPPDAATPPPGGDGPPPDPDDPSPDDGSPGPDN